MPKFNTNTSYSIQNFSIKILITVNLTQNVKFNYVGFNKKYFYYYKQLLPKFALVKFTQKSTAVQRINFSCKTLLESINN